MFGVFYENIEESDREASYFLVEVVIIFIEDAASIFYYLSKMTEGVATKTDLASVMVSFVMYQLLLWLRIPFLFASH